MILLWVCLVIFMCSLVGASAVKIYRCQFNVEEILNMWKLYPLIGIFLCMNIFQILQIFIPVKYSFMFFYVIILWCLWYLRNDLKKCKIFIKKNYLLLLLLGMGLIVFSWPMLMRGELCSIQKINNDIQYYLSTMDWLYNHNLREPIIYSETLPYYFCADYIIKSTRFGFDTLGALFMGVFNLEAHQVFSPLGVVSILMANLTAHFFLTDVLRVSQKYGLFFLLVLGTCFNWYVLMTLQYVPQILGIAGLLGFTSMSILWLIKDIKSSRFWVALFLTGVAGAYAEFASYMFILFVGYLGIAIWCERKSIIKVWGIFKESFYMAVIAVLLNPLAILIAVRFNLSILTKVSNSPSNIDAYGGNLRNIPDLFATLLGVANLGNSYTKYYILLFICIAVLTLLFILSLKKINKVYSAILWSIFFFFAYECYFRVVSLAYGEFKHLISINIFVLIGAFYFAFHVSEIFGKVRFNKFLTWLVCFGSVGFFSLNLLSIIMIYPLNEYFYFDSQLMRLKEVQNFVPEDTLIGIAGDRYDMQHGAIYALKDIPVQIIGNSENSYYTAIGHIPYTQEWGKYVLALGLDEQYGSKKNYDIIWNNGMYYLFQLRGEEK